MTKASDRYEIVSPERLDAIRMIQRFSGDLEALIGRVSDEAATNFHPDFRLLSILHGLMRDLTLALFDISKPNPKGGTDAR